MKRKSVLAILCLVLAVSPVVGLAETMYVVTTHPGDRVSMLTKPDYDTGSLVATVPSGTAVDIITIMADVPWAEVSYVGQTGYIAMESLSKNSPSSALTIPNAPIVASGPVTQTMYVTSHNGEGVHLRSDPSISDHNIIATVPFGKTVGVITIMADVPWAEIEYNGQVGYMMIDHLTGTKPEHHTADSESTAGQFDDLETGLKSMFAGFVSGGYSAVVKPAQGETYVNLRWAPSMSAPVRSEYNADAVLWVSSHDGTWSEVYDEALDIHGYMESSFLQKQ